MNVSANTSNFKFKPQVTPGLCSISTDPTASLVHVEAY